MRSKIYRVIEVANIDYKISRLYDILMLASIFFSLVPIAMKRHDGIYLFMEVVTTFIFMVDYGLRFYTADFYLGKGKKSFAIYPFTPMAIIDLLSILPSLTVVHPIFLTFEFFRLFRSFRILRIFRVLRYSKSVSIIFNVFRKQRESLLLVGTLAIGYILTSALIIMSVEPQSFDNFFDAVYWATVSLTTVGYGDIYPVTVIGKMITMISSFFGIAVVALPAGIITAGYMEEIHQQNEKKKKDKEK